MANPCISLLSLSLSLCVCVCACCFLSLCMAITTTKWSSRPPVLTILMTRALTTLLPLHLHPQSKVSYPNRSISCTISFLCQHYYTRAPTLSLSHTHTGEEFSRTSAVLGETLRRKLSKVEVHAHQLRVCEYDCFLIILF